MIGLIQRVREAKVEVEGKTVSSIDSGILLFLGVEKDDDESKISSLAKKIFNYRIFPDEQGKMNLSLLDINAQLLVVSQFTLVAQTKKGNRPGFSNGAPPEEGKRIYEQFIKHVNQNYTKCESGVFGADMQVHLVNDGPVTFHFQI